MLSNDEIASIEAELDNELLNAACLDLLEYFGDDNLDKIQADALDICNAHRDSVSNDELKNLPGFELLLRSTRSIECTRKESSKIVYETKEVLDENRSHDEKNTCFSCIDCEVPSAAVADDGSHAVVAKQQLISSEVNDRIHHFEDKEVIEQSSEHIPAFKAVTSDSVSRINASTQPILTHDDVGNMEPDALECHTGWSEIDSLSVFDKLFSNAAIEAAESTNVIDEKQRSRQNYLDKRRQSVALNRNARKIQQWLRRIISVRKESFCDAIQKVDEFAITWMLRLAVRQWIRFVEETRRSIIFRTRTFERVSRHHNSTMSLHRRQQHYPRAWYMSTLSTMKIVCLPGRKIVCLPGRKTIGICILRDAMKRHFCACKINDSTWVYFDLKYLLVNSSERIQDSLNELFSTLDISRMSNKFQSEGALGWLVAGSSDLDNCTGTSATLIAGRDLYNCFYSGNQRNFLLDEKIQKAEPSIRTHSSRRSFLALPLPRNLYIGKKGAFIHLFSQLERTLHGILIRCAFKTLASYRKLFQAIIVLQKNYRGFAVRRRIRSIQSTGFAYLDTELEMIMYNDIKELIDISEAENCSDWIPRKPNAQSFEQISSENSQTDPKKCTPLRDHYSAKSTTTHSAKIRNESLVGDQNSFVSDANPTMTVAQKKDMFTIPDIHPIRKTEIMREWRISDPKIAQVSKSEIWT